MKTHSEAEYLYGLIAQGEHQQQDFKFEISDARKIAKSLSAFSNTKGGRLLVGVKDNGKIAGVRSEEEIYMIEAAARLYSKPSVDFRIKKYTVEGKNVLEIIIPEGKNKPYFAKDDDNRYKAYIRIDDENILATPIHIKVWQSANAPRGTLVRYSEAEQQLLDFLTRHEKISLTQYCKLIPIPRFRAIHILANLVSFGIIEPFFCNRKFYYRLLPTPPFS